jgi:dipeptidyl aminopeptidase/acylaminoacyl peptidase
VTLGVAAKLVERLSTAPRCGRPSLSPDGHDVAVSSDRDGEARLWLLARSGGPARPITPPHSSAVTPEWSPAGDLIAYLSRDRRGAVVRTVRPDGSDRRDLLRADGNIQLGGWTSDGRSLVIVAELAGNGRARPYLVAFDDGATRPVCPGHLPGTVTISDVAGDHAVLIHALDRVHGLLAVANLRSGEWTPVIGGGQALAISGARLVQEGVAACCDADHDRVGLMLFRRRDNGWHPVRQIHRADADLEAWTRTADGEFLLSWNLSGISHLQPATFAGESGRPAPPVPAPAPVIFGLTAVPGIPDVICHGASATQPSTLWCGGADRWHELETGSADSVRGLPLVTPEPVVIPAADGMRLDGWWYRPASWSAGGPAVISFHGGPAQQERPLFNPTYQMLACAGIAVLAPNVRGSSGRGRQFAALDDLAGRRTAMQDIDSCVAWLGTPSGTAGRLGVFGASYGGFMALNALRRMPARINAAVVLSAIADLPLFFRDASDQMRASSMVEYGDPVRDTALLRELSPLRDLKNCDVPVLIVHGRLDSNVPFSQAEALQAALRGNRSPVCMLAFDDEGHGVHRPPNKVRLNTEVLSWFLAHLT